MKRRRRLGLTLLACIAAGGPAAAQSPPPPQDSTPAAPATPDAGDSPVAALLDFKNWTTPPLKLSGSLAYDFRATRAREEGNSSTHLFTGTISARTFLYQPWFALASGNLRLTTSRTKSEGNSFNDPLMPQEVSGGEQFLSGNLRLDVFPRSRFPFEFHLERTDSRIDTGLAPSFDFRTMNIGFSQRYRPADGTYDLAGAYDHRTQSGTGFRDVQDTLSADFGTRWKANELALGLSLSEARRQLTDESTQFRSLVARHQYSPPGPLSINTTVNFTQTIESLVGSPSDLSVLQWSSVGLYHQEASPLTYTGSFRGVMLRDALGGHDLENVGGTAGVNYEFTRNLRLTANGALSVTNSNGAHAQSAGAAAGASWQADTLDFATIRYDRFATANVATNATTGGLDGNETQVNVGAQAGHSVAKTFALSQRSALVLQMSQSLTVSHNRSNREDALFARQSLRSVLHSGAVTWNINGDGKQAYARATLSDSRELGGGHARFQLFNFQLSGTIEFDRNHTLTGDITYQRAVQRAGDTLGGPGLDPTLGERTAANSSSGEIVYRWNRLFGQPGLRFSSRIKLAQDVLRQPGTLPNLPDHETRLWENRLDWSIGRLETGVLFRISTIDGKPRDFLMFRLQRSLGD